MTASKIEIHKVCEYCGKTFVAWKSTTRFCSKTCNSRAYKQFRREQRIAAIENETNTRPIEKIRDKTILSPKEVAVLLGLSTRNVYYLINKGLLKASEGAQVVDLSEYDMPPCIIITSAGTTIYATRDLASLKDRINKYDFDKAIYVVGNEQRLHFKQVFKVLELMGYRTICGKVPTKYFEEKFYGLTVTM